MTTLPQNNPAVKPVSPACLYDLAPIKAMEWLYCNVWITLSPQWQGAREALIFDGRDKPIILYRGEMCRTSYSEYVSLMRSDVVSADPEIPLPYDFNSYPEVRLRFRPSPRKPTTGVVYIIGNGRGEYKIGRAKNVRRRLAQFQSASVDNMTLHLVFPTPDSLNAERWFHHFFFRQRINGEWFRLSESDLLKAQMKAQEATK